MKILKAVFNILGIFVATLFSLLLVALLVVTPMISTASSFLKADTIHSIVKKIDFSAFADSLPEINGIDTSFLHEFMETELMEDVLTLYIDGTFAILEGEKAQAALTSDAFKSIAEEHMDELLPIVKSYAGTDIPLSDKSLQLIVNQLIDTMVPNVLSMLPTLEELGLDAPAISFLKKLYNGTYLKFMIFVIAAFSLLVVLCRFPRFKGFMWLGVVYLISAVLVFLISLLFKSGGRIALVEPTTLFMSIINPLLSILSTEMLKATCIMALLGIVFIIIFVIGRKVLLLKHTAQTPQTE